VRGSQRLERCFGLGILSAIMTVPTVNSFAQASALWMGVGEQVSSKAPFTIEAVSPSIPAEAPRALLAAAASMLDRLELTLLMDALALFVSISTTSSSLLPAAIRA
jgi:hypothetical protein